MTEELGHINIEPKSGEELLTFNQKETGFQLIDFWKWSVSDIISNATRGRFAEFIVASALKIDLSSVRNEWSPYDLISPQGIKIEVKSSSYLQSWFQKKHSTINFSIKAARHWDNHTGIQAPTSTRQSDIYVFCLLKHKDKGTLNPLCLEQWEFYVLPTLSINNYKRSKSSITLKSLQTLTAPISYHELEKTIINTNQNTEK